MRKLTLNLIILFFLTAGVMAQSPEAFQYQAVIRDSGGNPRANEVVTLGIAIIQGSANGSIVYNETHEPTTNGVGLVTLEIGNGSSGDSFSAIEWSDGPWFIEVSVNGTEMGTSQLLSVPFAKYADQAGNAFSGSFNDLQDVPLNLDTDSTDDAAANFAQLNGIPEYLDTDSTDDFSGSYGDLTGRPSAISDFTMDANGGRIITLGEPVSPDDAATKAYVDTASGGGGWSLTGNTAIDPSNQFLGTLDAQPLIFKVNNTERMRLDTSGSLGFPNSGGSVFIGSGAGENDDLANNQNIYIGDSTGYTNTGGSGNVGIGYGVMYSNTYGYSNTSTGYQSMHSNTGGDFNTAQGYEALYSNTTGGANTSVGYRSLNNNEDGGSNTAIGYRTLHGNTSGSYNTAGGSLALLDNTTGNNNTAFGYRAAQSNTTGTANVAIGNRSLYHATTQDNNIAIGDSALFNTGSTATVSGEGDDNIAIGTEALNKNTLGYGNISIGLWSMHLNTSGSNNTSIGNYSMQINDDGTSNTAMGADALRGNYTGSSNTAVGAGALFHNETGDYNTAMGASAGPPWLGYEDLVNTGAFGYDATVTSSNTIRIGNSSITQIGGAVGWSNLSDGRFKTNVTPDVPGLDFILKLRPVTFNWDLDALDRFHGRDRDEKGQEEPPAMKKARREKEQKDYTGFVAQQVEEAAESIDFDFSGIRKPANEKSTYNLSYAEFVIPLVKAVQEQQKKIQEQQKLIEQLMEEIEGLK
jgi:hypothetical protein